jgi:folylpolyglutamate synthase/dihydropteroate synthase
MMKSFEDRVKEMRAAQKENEETYDYTAPHLTNVNEDPLLNGKIF